MTNFARVLASRSPLLDGLDHELERTAASGHRLPARLWNRAIGEPLREFLARPGKEFRGQLADLFFRIGGGNGSPPTNLPLVVEALHAGSLIIDDIEDESSERRGGPTLHRMHGLPLALNAGNWLYFWAYSLLGDLALPPETRALAERLTTRSLLDCHYGQALDVSIRVSELSQSEVSSVVHATTELKTGSLLGLAAGLGALLGGGPQTTVAAAVRFGRELGTALQMLDDLSGIISLRRAHKGQEDLRLDRPSWPWAWLAASLDAATYEELRDRANEVTAGAEATPLLRELKSALGPFAQRRVHEHLELAQTRLADALPARTSLAALRRELERLEKSYV
ncbi:MAG: polyprenyl synthetase family protein [Pseudomonadota bacterium]